MDLLIQGIPDEIGEEQFREWCGIIVERFHNAKLNSIKEVVQATEAAKSGIDGFRRANALKPKFAAVDEAKPVIEAPVEVVKGEAIEAETVNQAAIRG